MLAGFGNDDADDHAGDDPDSASDPEDAVEELTFGSRRPDQRTKRIALCALGIVAAIIVVVIVSVRFIDTDNTAARPPANSPAGAAVRWTSELLRGHVEAPPATGCPDSLNSYFLPKNAKSISVRGVVRVAADRWRVTLAVGGPHNTIPLTVVKQAGSYLVC